MAAPLFDARTPGHDRRAAEWRFVHDVYTGGYLPAPGSSTVLPSSRALSGPGISSNGGENPYLPRRSQAESAGEYAARLQVLDPDMLFSRAVSSLAGQIAAAESQVSRTWAAEDAEAFGSVDAEDTRADRLWKDADGEGTPWPVFWRQGTADLILYQEVWRVVSGVTTEDVPAGVNGAGAVTTEKMERDPRVQAIEPGAVVYVREAAGRPVQVHVLTRREADALADREKAQEVLTIYRLAGWERRVRDEGATDDGTVEASGTYAYYEDAGKRRRRLPVYRVRLPLRQPVAYLLARKAVARLNMENRRDSLVNKANTPRLVLNSDEESPSVPEELVQGATFHRIAAGAKLGFIEPGTAGADLGTRILTEKERAFQAAAWQTFNDQAVQATATEVREESRGGAGAFLTLLSGAVDADENTALWLLAQAHGLPPEEWAVARVERSTKFVAFDEAEQAKSAADLLFGMNPLPADTKARTAAVKRVLDVNGLPYDDEALAAAVEAWGAAQEGADAEREQAQAAAQKAIDAARAAEAAASGDGASGAVRVTANEG